MTELSIGSKRQLLILADDLTGALDTGIQFAKRGLRTSVVGVECEYGAYPDTDVFVIDTESRHLSGEDAYGVLYRAVKRACACGIARFLKKTDSGLRGNIAAEITAVMDAAGIGTVAFIPAFPQINRTVVGRISYIDGVPINKSVYGADPLNPVSIERVADLFADQKYRAAEYSDPKEFPPHADEEQIAVFDSAAKSDIESIVGVLNECGCSRLYAGCAGLADVLAETMGSRRAGAQAPEGAEIPGGGEVSGDGEIPGAAEVPEGFLVICGSISPVSLQQLRYAAEQGYKCLCIPVETINETVFPESDAFAGCVSRIRMTLAEEKVCIISTESIGEKAAESAGTSADIDPGAIAANLGKLLGGTLSEGLHPVIMIIGGDTLFHITEELSCRELQLVSEPERGVVCVKMKTAADEYTVLTKSGGFGDEQLLVRLIRSFSGGSQ